MEEKWKEIPGYEGYYKISTFGNVKSLERYVQRGNCWILRKSKDKKLYKNRDGYYTVKLSKDGHDRRYFVHALVAKTFICNKDYSDGWEVNHIDCNRENNHVNNLEWVRHNENVKYSVNKGHYSNKHDGVKNGRCVPTVMYDAIANETKSFNYIGECIEYMFSTNPELKELTSVNNLRHEIHKRQNNGKSYRKRYKFYYA